LQILLGANGAGVAFGGILAAGRTRQRAAQDLGQKHRLALDLEGADQDQGPTETLPPAAGYNSGDFSIGLVPLPRKMLAPGTGRGLMASAEPVKKKRGAVDVLSSLFDAFKSRG
jgi:hypothetical protein